MRTSPSRRAGLILLAVTLAAWGRRGLPVTPPRTPAPPRYTTQLSLLLAGSRRAGWWCPLGDRSPDNLDHVGPAAATSMDTVSVRVSDESSQCRELSVHSRA
jgi:hypothetical protein